MQIKRVYNNNVVMVSNEDSEEEMIVIGKGLAFQRRAGDLLDTERIEKVFTLRGKNVLNRLEKLIRDIPSVYLTIAEEIVEMLKSESNLEIDENIYITLTDHISMSLEREKNHIICENPLLMEIKQFYKMEFELSRKAAQIIYNYMNIWISEEEMGFIALHIVNASMKQRSDTLINSIQMISDILKIVQESVPIEMNKDSLMYDRFVRHLQFFARRVLDKGEEQLQTELKGVLERSEYTEEFACVERIADYIKHTYGKKVTEAEKGYLAYHVILIFANR